MANIFYLDFVNGNDSNDGSDWANAWKTITAGPIAARIDPGDTVRCAKSPAPIDMGFAATWENNVATLTLPSGTIKNVAMCESAWVGGTADVTPNVSSTYKIEGTNSASLAVGVNFTTGIVGYLDLGSTQDFSSYRLLNFCIRTSTTVTANKLRIDLCDDTVGASPIYSFTIAVNVGSTNFSPFVFDNGGAFSTGIRSITIYAVSDPGTVTIYIDDIFVSKASSAADSLTLRTLISNSNSASTLWYSIKSINAETLTLGGVATSTGTDAKFFGTTSSYEVYKRPLIDCTALANPALQDNGTDGNLITISGGWNTSTTERDEETWLFFTTNVGWYLDCTSRHHYKFEYFGFVGMDYIKIKYGYDAYFDHISFVHCNGQGYGVFSDTGYQCDTITATNININVINGYGLVFAGESYGQVAMNFSNVKVYNTSSSAVRMAGGVMEGNFDNFTIRGATGANGTGLICPSTNWNCKFRNWNIQYCAVFGVSLNNNNCWQGGPGFTFYSLYCANNTSGDLDIESCTGQVVFYNTTLASATPISFFAGYVKRFNASFHNWGNVAGRFYTYQTYPIISDIKNLDGGLAGTISDQVTNGQSAAYANGGSGTCVALNPANVTYPLQWEFKIPVTAAMAFVLKFYITKTTSDFNGSVKVTIFDSHDDDTKLLDQEVINNASVPLNDGSGDDWTYQYAATSVTPTDTGFCRVLVEARDGTATGDILIDNVSVS